MQSVEGLERSSPITSKGQVTIPVEVRRVLGVKPRDRVSFVVENHEVHIRRADSVVARTAGIFKSSAPALSAEELREAAESAMAEVALERST